MRRPLAAFCPILVLASLALTAHAQTPPARNKAPGASETPAGKDPANAADPSAGAPAVKPNVAATGRVMPPTSGRTPPAAGASGSVAQSNVQAEMLKAQKAAEARNKAWDTRMRKTMGSICSGC